jgi:hypothetical protein
MKNKVWFLVLVLLSYTLLVGVAGAQERIRVFELSSGPSFGEFQARMQEAGLLDGDRVATSVLGTVAWRFAQENDYLRLVPASNRTEDSYVELFKRWNGLGETITLTEFRRKGQGAGFWLPIARPVARTHTTTVLSTTELVQSLRDLQQQVEGLTGVGQEGVTLLRGRVTQLSEQLGELTTSNASLQGALHLLEERLAGDLSRRALRTDEVIDEVNTRLQSEIGSLNSRLQVVERTVTNHGARLDRVERQVSSQNAVGWKTVALIAFLFMLVPVYLAWRWANKNHPDNLKIYEKITRVEKRQEGLEKDQRGVVEALALAQTRMRDVELGAYGVQFSPDLVSRDRLEAMKNGEKVTLTVTDEQDHKFLVEVIKGEKVTLSGVQRRKGGGQESMTVPLSTHVPSLIAKAAREGRLTSLQGGQAEKAVA